MKRLWTKTVKGWSDPLGRRVQYAIGIPFYLISMISGNWWTGLLSLIIVWNGAKGFADPAPPAPTINIGNQWFRCDDE